MLIRPGRNSTFAFSAGASAGAPCGATFEPDELLLLEGRLREARSAASIADLLALSRCPASVASFRSVSALATASRAD